MLNDTGTTALKDEYVEFLRKLGDVVTEICYQLDANDLLPPSLLKVGRNMTAPAIRTLPCDDHRVNFS